MALAEQMPFKRTHELYAHETLEASDAETDDDDLREAKRRSLNDGLPAPPPASPVPAPVAEAPLAPPPPVYPRIPSDLWNLILGHLLPSELIAARFIKAFAMLPSVASRPKGCLKRASNAAARHGYYTQLMWFHDALRMPWNSSLCVTAAGVGRLDVLEWMLEAGCELHEDLFCAAAEEGCRNILEWGLLRGVVPTRDLAAAAAEGGRLDLLKWLKSIGCPFTSYPRDPEMCNRAAKGESLIAHVGNLEVLDWLRQQGCTLDRWAAVFATVNGHFEVLKWLYANGCTLSASLCTDAADYGHLDILEWLTTHVGLQWHKMSMQHINNVRILKWAAAHGLPLTAQVCLSAARNGHLDVLIWARENHCPWNDYEVLCAAANFGKLAVMQWALNVGGAQYRPGVAAAAAQTNNVEVLRWLYEEGYALPVKLVAKAAFKTSQRLVEAVQEMFGDELYAAAIENRVGPQVTAAYVDGELVVVR